MKYFVVIAVLLHVLSVSALSQHKAEIDKSYIDTMIEHEKYFTEHNKMEAPEATKWFRIVTSENSRILFLAPHTTSQTREGNIKASDAGTGGLIETLNIIRGVSIMYTTYLSPSDPNYYDDNEFKDSLKVLLKTLKPKFVIDLHASDESRPYDIDYGTMNGKSLLKRSNWLDTLSAVFKDCGISNLSDNFFAAEKQDSDTKFVSKHGYPCLQLEINAKYLSPDEGKNYASRTRKLLQALLNFIDKIEN